MKMPRPDHYITNWNSSELPFWEKLAVAARNNAIKIKNGSACCGNHGEPGC